MLRLILLVLFVVGSINWLLHERAVDSGPGVLAPEVPKQTNLVDATPVSLGEYSLKPLAEFSLDARVLARENYRWDGGAELAPMDLVLGWGPMSDRVVLEQIKITQSARWYRWKVKQFLIPQRAIETHSANMHLVPANKDVRRAMKSARVGQLVSLSGQLVEISRADGWRWRSSLTRDDVGGGSCELILVEQIAFVN